MAMRTRMAVFSLLFLLSIVAPFSLPPPDSAAAQEQKMTIETLVARHLEAIGAGDARAKVASRVASGKSNFLVRLGGSTNIDGSAMLVSTGPKIRFGMRFPAPDYPGEDLAFDGNRAATAMLPQGGRSGLSRFLESQNLPLKEGLLGGVLSTSWPLLRVGEAQPRLEYRGLKKIDDRQLHEVNYRARKGGNDLKVLLYFDPQTFRHVRSKHSFEVAATIGSREAANANPESYYSLTEDFDDFRAVDGLTLPHKYRLQYSAEGRVNSSLYEWTVLVDSISHQEKIDSQLFSIK